MRLRQKIKIIFIVLSMQLLLSGYMISRREMIDVSTLPERPDIVLNEICSINQYSYPNEIGEYFAWIELYNQSDMEVSLAGYGLTDCPDEGIKFVFGDVVMPPETYRLVYLANARATCFDTDSQYADFQLSGKGGRFFACQILPGISQTVCRCLNLPRIFPMRENMTVQESGGHSRVHRGFPTTVRKRFLF